MDITAQIINGRLKIESTTEKGSEQLDKWLNENKKYLDKWLNIDIFAH